MNGIEGFRVGLFAGAVTAGLAVCVAGLAGVAICQPTPARRVAPVVLLISAALFLGVVIGRWWLS